MSTVKLLEVYISYDLADFTIYKKVVVMSDKILFYILYMGSIYDTQ